MEESPSGLHPSRSLPSRAQGYGIAAGYERPYLRTPPEPHARQKDEYGPIPHSGYYGSGDAARPFKRGQAGYREELPWYLPQYGEQTSGHESTE
ncbi:MAG TPA: hypothetical protein VLE20_11680 [Blastocatellia bacterium]|nr:hypothetical protein [Blastocatellia bacterium]